MATSHKTREQKTQQALQKPRKKRLLNSNTSPGLEQSLSPARLGELMMRAVLSPVWTNPPRVQGRELPSLARVGVTAVPAIQTFRFGIHGVVFIS